MFDELRHWPRPATRPWPEGPIGCSARVPFPPDVTTRIEVLGPLRLLVDGEPVDRPEQRRARVRELLALLVVFGSVGRERAMDLLWPDLSAADAARNLRVTLTYLRRWLEPERGRGEAGFHLRVDERADPPGRLAAARRRCLGGPGPPPARPAPLGGPATSPSTPGISNSPSGSGGACR